MRSTPAAEPKYCHLTPLALAAGVLLTPMLAQGASHGLVQPPELEPLTDRAAYMGLQNDEFIRTLCRERGWRYDPAQWVPGPRSVAILEEVEALRVFERTKFLEGPKKGEEEHRIDPDRLRHEVRQLHELFPAMEREAVENVYRGFGGNFESTFEMLSLAFAE